MDHQKQGQETAPLLRRSTRLVRGPSLSASVLGSAGHGTAQRQQQRYKNLDTRTSIDLGPGRGPSHGKPVTPNTISTAAAPAPVSELRNNQSGSWSLLPDEVSEIATDMQAQQRFSTFFV